MSEEKPLELEGSYFDSLYEHSNRKNIEKDKLSNYDTMIRDEIQIRAEKEFAVEHARAEALAQGKAEGEAIGRAEGRAEGEAIGRAEAMNEIAAKLKAMGLSDEIINSAIGQQA